MKHIAILITLLILLGSLFTGCGISKDTYDAAINEANELEEQLTTVQTALAAAQDDIDTYQSEIATLQDEITDYESQVADYQSQITPLQSQLEIANNQIDTLQSQIEQLESTDSQIAALQSQVDELQVITGLSLYSVILEMKTIYQPANVYENIVSFTADYAGYVVVSGTSSTFYTDIRVDNSFTGYPYGEYLHHFGTGTTLKIPVLPGTINVYLSNTNPTGLAATITITYYY